MGRSYPRKDLKLLWGFAAGRCAFPDCRRRLLEPGTEEDGAVTTGEIAHINGHSPGGPRYDPDMTDGERNSYENWLLLCGSHHNQVDGQDSTFSADDLRKMKEDHEDWVHNRLSEEIIDVTSVELEQVTVALVQEASDQVESFEVVPPLEKINRNGLGGKPSMLIKMGLAQSHRVEKYIRQVNKADPTFEDRLTSSFIQHYNSLIEDDMDGDALFMEMFDFAIQGQDDFSHRAAGLAVLSHLFETCDVFES